MRTVYTCKALLLDTPKFRFILLLYYFTFRYIILLCYNFTLVMSLLCYFIFTQIHIKYLFIACSAF